MEVIEEDQPPKRIKTQQTFNPAAEKEEDKDRISLLPDRLIIDEILSRLDSTKYAIKTGTLSKRWQHLWPSVSTLIFSDFHMKQPSDHSLCFQPLPDFYAAVDKTLTQCRVKNLNKFKVRATYDNRFKSHVDNWIHFAISSNVRHFELNLSGSETDEKDRYVLKDDSLFINSNFTRLSLGGCVFDPNGLITWNSLTNLSILNANLEEDLIANILSGCPMLDTLILAGCYGYSLLDITSKSVKNLIFCGYAPEPHQDDLDDIIEIYAPYITSLAIEGTLMLWKILLRDVSSLVKADLDYTKLGHDETTRKEEREKMLKRFIVSLRHVKELKIGINCLTAFSRLEDKGFNFPSNVKVAKVTYPLYDTDDSELRNFFDNVKEEQEEEEEEEKEEDDKDRISLLPDRLIVDEILSRLDSTKDAIRTGTLSKRWQHLWPSVPSLFFSHYHMKKPSDHSLLLEPLPDFYVAVDKTLTQCCHRQSKSLNKFHVHAAYDNQFQSHVDNWIHFAISSNVQQLELNLSGKEYDEDRFVLEDDSLFINSHFTHLDLGGCVFNPTGPVIWNNLTSLSISNANLEEDLIANILSGSPLLDTLMLDECYGYSCLDITSKSVKNLIFYGYAPEAHQMDLDDIIEINAPYISSLEIKGTLMLWKILLRDVSSLVKADLDYTKLGHDETTRKEEREKMLKRFIIRLRHVQELKIGLSCLTALFRLEAKGFISPSNLKATQVTYPLYDTDDSMELGDCSDDDSSVGDTANSVLVTRLKA